MSFVDVGECWLMVAGWLMVVALVPKHFFFVYVNWAGQFPCRWGWKLEAVNLKTTNVIINLTINLHFCHGLYHNLYLYHPSLVKIRMIHYRVNTLFYQSRSKLHSKHIGPWKLDMAGHGRSRGNCGSVCRSTCEGFHFCPQILAVWTGTMMIILWILGCPKSFLSQDRFWQRNATFWTQVLSCGVSKRACHLRSFCI